MVERQEQQSWMIFLLLKILIFENKIGKCYVSGYRVSCKADDTAINLYENKQNMRKIFWITMILIKLGRGNITQQNSSNTSDYPDPVLCKFFNARYISWWEELLYSLIVIYAYKWRNVYLGLNYASGLITLHLKDPFHYPSMTEIFD